MYHPNQVNRIPDACTPRNSFYDVHNYKKSHPIGATPMINSVKLTFLLRINHRLFTHSILTSTMHHPLLITSVCCSTASPLLLGRNGSGTVLNNLPRAGVTFHVVMMVMHQTFVHQQVQLVVLRRRRRLLLLLLLRNHRHRHCCLLRRCRRLLLLFAIR